MQCLSRTTQSESFIDQKIKDYIASDITEKQEDLPYYVGIVQDKRGELKAINPQKYIIKHFFNSDTKSLKEGYIYQVEKKPDFSKKKICDMNEIHDRYDHFAKIILASASDGDIPEYIPPEDTDLTPEDLFSYYAKIHDTISIGKYYSGMMAEESGDFQTSLKWFRKAADDGHCVALFRLALYAKENPGVLPRTPRAYLDSARDNAPDGSPEMEMIQEEINSFEAQEPANAPPAAQEPPPRVQHFLPA